MRFSRQEYWSGLPCPPPGDLPDPGIKPTSPVSPAFQTDSLLLTHRGIERKAKSEVAQSCLTLYDPMDHSLPGSSVHGIFPGKNTRVGCHFLLQEIFLTQALNLGLPHCRIINLVSPAPRDIDNNSGKLSLTPIRLDISETLSIPNS